MLFNSQTFFVFFLIVYLLYLISDHKWQNRLLLVASYVFYGWWDWRFLSLIGISTVVDYIFALKIAGENDEEKRKKYLAISACSNFGMLGFFKYFNFFSGSFSDLMQVFGWKPDPVTLNIVLPVGISFYTFQTMSYVIDVYRKELPATRKFLDFALFISFFPQLVAGPIERAKHLLPQILAPRILNPEKFYEGCYLILWGLFQKVFVADNLAKIVDPVFASPDTPNGVLVLLVSYAFAFQVFADFAGYSDIARGLGKCMGFDIMINFNNPFFSANPQEFWQRWHISLSSWLRDYVYVPLGGNRKGPACTLKNIMITMILGGLWHGAAWTYVLWGAYHGFLLVIHRFLKPVLDRIRMPERSIAGKLWWGLRVAIFFHLWCFGMLLFRSQTVHQFLQMMRAILWNTHLSLASGVSLALQQLLFFTGLLVLIQTVQYLKKDLTFILRSPLILRAAFYYVFFYLIIFWSENAYREFIYFQF